MSTPRLTPQAAPPSDRVRVGAFTVDLALREIVALGGGSPPVRISAKAQGVLLALIAQAGKVVGREALLEDVWPDTMPGDDVVTQAVTQLRKAFGDSRKQTAYIETISKHGYRLIAEVEWLPARETTEPVRFTTTTVPADTQDPSGEKHLPDRGRRFALGWDLLAAVLLIFAIWGIYRLVGAPSAGGSLGAATPAATPMFAPLETFQRIASLPEHERSPSLSPDGAMLVHAREARDGTSIALMVQTASPLSPRALTEQVRGRYDMMPEWSPDGLQIAFVRFEPPRCVVMLVLPTGGGERELGPCINSAPEAVSWYPDSQALISASEVQAGDPSHPEGQALYRMPLATGRWERISYTRKLGDIDRYPSVSPDGRWIAFHRNLTIGDIWRVPVAGGVPQRMTHLRTHMEGVAWTSDSRALVFAREHNGKRILSKFEIATGQLSDFSLPGAHLAYPSTAGRSDALAFQIVDVRETILRLRLSLGRQSFAQAETVVASNGANRIPALSPDKTQLIFASDRAGKPQLWWQQIGVADSLRPIEGFVPRLTYPPDWDAASERLVAVGDGAQGHGIYEITPRLGRVEFLALPQLEPIQVLYHPDPTRMLVMGGDEDGRLGLTLYDRTARPWKVLARSEKDVVAAIVDRSNHRILFGRRSKSEVIQADLDLRAFKHVDALNYPRRQRSFAAASDGVWVMDVQPDCNWYWRRIADDNGTQTPKGVCLGNESPLPLDGILSYDEKRGEIYLSPLETLSDDIGYLPMAEGRR